METSSLNDALRPLQPGTLFHGRYRVERAIKQGGMGAVYEVVDGNTDRRRALKTMLPSIGMDSGLRDRFQREAKITANVESVHIVEVFDAGIDEATKMPFLVMELLKGDDLGTVVESKGRLSPSEVVQLLRQASVALDKTHDAGILHRNLKPENLFRTIGDDGIPRLKILEFGIAKVVESGQPKTTLIGLGTPLYMAPEQFEATKELDRRTDLYALGHVAFTLLTGHAYWEPEFKSRGAHAIAWALAKSELEAASVRASKFGVFLSPAFDEWFAQATAADPSQRFDTASELVYELHGALEYSPSDSGQRPGKHLRPVASPSLRSSGAPDGVIALSSYENAEMAGIGTREAARNDSTGAVSSSSRSDRNRSSLSVGAVRRRYVSTVGQSPQVFISYSREGEKHVLRVAGLASALRRDGLDCMLDQYLAGGPSEGWPLWCQTQVDDADVVLVVCTETYLRRALKKEKPGQGLGATWEAHAIYQQLYEGSVLNSKFKPVVFEREHLEFILPPLRGAMHYVLDSERAPDYQNLVRAIWGIPRNGKPPLGAPPTLVSDLVPPAFVRPDATVPSEAEPGTESAAPVAHRREANEPTPIPKPGERGNQLGATPGTKGIVLSIELHLARLPGEFSQEDLMNALSQLLGEPVDGLEIKEWKAGSIIAGLEGDPNQLAKIILALQTPSDAMVTFVQRTGLKLMRWQVEGGQFSLEIAERSAPPSPIQPARPAGETTATTAYSGSSPTPAPAPVPHGTDQPPPIQPGPKLAVRTMFNLRAFGRSRSGTGGSNAAPQPPHKSDASLLGLRGYSAEAPHASVERPPMLSQTLPPLPGAPPSAQAPKKRHQGRGVDVAVTGVSEARRWVALAHRGVASIPVTAAIVAAAIAMQFPATAAGLKAAVILGAMMMLILAMMLRLPQRRVLDLTSEPGRKGSSFFERKMPFVYAGLCLVLGAIGVRQLAIRPGQELGQQLDALFGERNWFVYPDNIREVGVKRLPKDFLVRDPVKYVDNDRAHSEIGERNPGDCGSNVGLSSPLKDSDVPAWQRQPLQVWKEACKAWQASTAPERIDQLFGNDTWKRNEPLTFSASGTPSHPVQLECPITSIDQNDLKYGIGMPPGRAGIETRIWVAGKIGERPPPNPLVSLDPPPSMRRVDLSWVKLKDEGGFAEQCLPKDNGFVLRVLSRRGTGGGAFAGCCALFSERRTWRRVWALIEARAPEQLLHVKLEGDDGRGQEYLHSAGWSGRRAVQIEIDQLREVPIGKFCVMAVGQNEAVENEIAVTDLYAEYGGGVRPR